MAVILYKVIEKSFSHGRQRFVTVGGVWRDSKEKARADANRLAPVSLAHRMFIFSPNKHGSDVVEEVELEPLEVRMNRVNDAVLAAVNPSKLERVQGMRAAREGRIRAWQAML